MIDAGHGGADFGATYNGRQEKDDNLRLALAVGEILSENGIDVEYTRTTDVYQTPFEKATLGNQSGADFSFLFTGIPVRNRINTAVWKPLFMTNPVKNWIWQKILTEPWENWAFGKSA